MLHRPREKLPAARGALFILKLTLFHAKFFFNDLGAQCSCMRMEYASADFELV